MRFARAAGSFGKMAVAGRANGMRGLAWTTNKAFVPASRLDTQIKSFWREQACSRFMQINDTLHSANVPRYFISARARVRRRVAPVDEVASGMLGNFSRIAQPFWKRSRWTGIAWGKRFAGCWCVSCFYLREM